MGPGSWVLRKNLLSFPKTMTILEFYKNKIYFNQLLPGHWSTLFSIWIRRQIILPIFWKTKSMAVIVNPLLLTMAPQTNWTSLIFVNFMLITKLWHLIYHHPPDKEICLTEVHEAAWPSSEGASLELHKLSVLPLQVLQLLLGHISSILGVYIT